MAGFYADVPAPRMAYDTDGSVGFFMSTTSAVSLLSGAQLVGGNDENTSSSLYNAANSASTSLRGWVGLVFPQLRDISGIGLHLNTPGDNLSTSADTTNGVDGTWTSRGTTSSFNVLSAGTKTVMRSSISVVNWTGVKAIRWGVLNNPTNDPTVYTAHIYGAIAAGQEPDRLRLWHPTLDEPLDDNNSADGAWFDWGDATRNTMADKTFRIKNNSASLTANSIAISTSTLTDTTPTLGSQIVYSDGGSFQGSINIGNLLPGQISSVLTVRRTTLSNAALSLWWARIAINAGSWS